jgi:hypothetical protein
MPHTDEYALPRRSRGCACGNGLPGRCPGRAACPYSGDNDATDADLADEAGSDAFKASEAVGTLLDRYSGDWGDEPDAITDWAERLRQIETEIIATLGKPRVRSRTGCLVPAKDA